MGINGTLVNLYHVCKRECWLHANGITMEHTSEIVYDGKILHESSYPQRNKKHSELHIQAKCDTIVLNGTIDFYDADQKVIHETKRSNKAEKAHEWQIKYYLWLLKLNGVEDASAILEYPLLRHKVQVVLHQEDIQYLKNVIGSISQLMETEICPPVIRAKICEGCSYYELCYIKEE